MVIAHARTASSSSLQQIVSTAEHATASVIIASTGNAVENGNVKQPTKRMNFKIMHLWAITSNKAWCSQHHQLLIRRKWECASSVYIATSATSATTIAGSQIVLRIMEIRLQASVAHIGIREYGSLIISLVSCHTTGETSVGQDQCITLPKRARAVFSNTKSSTR